MGGGDEHYRPESASPNPKGRGRHAYPAPAGRGHHGRSAPCPDPRSLNAPRAVIAYRYSRQYERALVRLSTPAGAFQLARR